MMGALSQCGFDDALILSNAIRPFVGARFNLKRDASGYVIPRNIFIDISSCGVCYCDARVEEVTSHGVKLVTLGAASIVYLDWSDIVEVVIRGDDGSKVVAFDRFAVAPDRIAA